MDLTNTFRSTNSGASLQTNFGSFPYNNTLAGPADRRQVQRARTRASAFVWTRRLRARTCSAITKAISWAVPATRPKQHSGHSNSLLYRLRHYWVDVRKGLLGSAGRPILEPDYAEPQRILRIARRPFLRRKRST